MHIIAEHNVVGLDLNIGGVDNDLGGASQTQVKVIPFFYFFW